MQYNAHRDPFPPWLPKLMAFVIAGGLIYYGIFA